MVPFKYALKEAMRFRKILPWIFMAFCSLVLAAAWKQFDREATGTDRFVNVTNLLVFRLLPLASAIYATMVVSQEVEQKTIVYLLTRPLDRWKLLLGRWGGAMTAVFILSMISLTAALVGSGGNIKINLGRDIFALFVGVLAYGSLFLFITLIINRALIVCVLFAFGWESSIPNLPTGLQKLSILSHLQAIAQHPEAAKNKGILDFISGILGENNMNPTVSAFSLLVFSILMLGLSAYWFTTHEYVPREDSE